VLTENKHTFTVAMTINSTETTLQSDILLLIKLMNSK